MSTLAEVLAIEALMTSYGIVPPGEAPRRERAMRPFRGGKYADTVLSIDGVGRFEHTPVNVVELEGEEEFVWDHNTPIRTRRSDFDLYASLDWKMVFILHHSYDFRLEIGPLVYVFSGRVVSYESARTVEPPPAWANLEDLSWLSQAQTRFTTAVKIAVRSTPRQL